MLLWPNIAHSYLGANNEQFNPTFDEIKPFFQNEANHKN
jgi:hypothetical protein